MNICVECGPTETRIRSLGKCVSCYMRPRNKARNRTRDRKVPRLPIEPFAEYFERNKSLLYHDRRTDIGEVIENNQDGIMVFVADRILIDDFGIHPAELYGREWWTA